MALRDAWGYISNYLVHGGSMKFYQVAISKGSIVLDTYTKCVVTNCKIHHWGIKKKVTNKMWHKDHYHFKFSTYG